MCNNVTIYKFTKNWFICGMHKSYHKPEFKQKIINAETGKRNWHWKGGLRHHYHTYYTKLLSGLKRECMICGNTKDIIVHHINNNFTDNRLENLSLVCRGCHNTIHKTKRKEEEVVL